MGRWEPDARGRLEQAALELFEERGYARTTVEDIAARAGLTERTFFRYFTDKREVLFSGSGALESLMVDSIGAAPTATAPLAAVTAAFDALAPWFAARRSHARKRRTVIAAHPELRERELIKLSTLAAAIASILRKRGLAAPAASLVAETGIAIFKNAFERWADDAREQDFTVHVRAAVAALQAATTGIAIFKNAFERWADDTREQDFTVHVRAAVTALQAATTGIASPPASSRSKVATPRAPSKRRR